MIAGSSIPTRRLEELCEINIGKTPSRAKAEYWNGSYPWLSIADMNQGRSLQKTKEGITEAGIKASGIKLVPKGTLVLSYKLSIGKVGITGRDMFTNEAIAALPIKDSNLLDLNYLYWALSTIDLLGSSDRAAMGKTLNKSKLKQIQVPLPPLEEQKRIAKILDAADALRTKRRESLAQLQSLLQSTFLDMFGDPASCESHWDRCVLGDVVEFAKDGPHVSPEYSEEGIPFLSARHVRPGKIIWEDLKHVSQEEAQRQWKKCRPQEGDILYTKGGTTGIAATVTTPEPFAIWVHVALLRPLTNLVHPMWLEAMLNTKYCYQQSQKYTHGIANRDLGLKRMVKIDMYLPPLELQARFVGVAKLILRERQRYLDHLGELDSLFLSLQSRAFVGEV